MFDLETRTRLKSFNYYGHSYTEDPIRVKFIGINTSVALFKNIDKEMHISVSLNNLSELLNFGNFNDQIYNVECVVVENGYNLNLIPITSETYNTLLNRMTEPKLVSGSEYRIDYNEELIDVTYLGKFHKNLITYNHHQNCYSFTITSHSLYFKKTSDNSIIEIEHRDLFRIDEKISATKVSSENYIDFLIRSFNKEEIKARTFFNYKSELLTKEEQIAYIDNLLAQTF